MANEEEDDLCSNAFPENEPWVTKKEILSIVWLLTLGYPIRCLVAMVGFSIGCLTGDKAREDWCVKQFFLSLLVFGGFWLMIYVMGLKCWELIQQYILN